MHKGEVPHPLFNGYRMREDSYLRPLTHKTRPAGTITGAEFFPNCFPGNRTGVD